ncbi:polysaccharide biosynthesis tyrosine autokinase [Altererythrobacter sp. ZODW24]|uniref:GumC family protein n=1 Tax=Altererythrobacter sp. ZODW24 TaxID=2185142 RepID=UPI000DF79001|nr:polysaccharide biosynthesis tyrosine autokinase [Altererythrobacter sp. ZODW24]
MANAQQDVAQEAFPMADDGYPKGRSFFDLTYLWALFRRNLWLILAMVGLGVALALAATLLATPLYRATATVQVNEAADRVLGDEDTDAAGNISDYERFLQTQLDLLTSRALAERVEKSLELSEDMVFFEAQGVAASSLPSSREERAKMAIWMLRSGLSAERPRNTRVVPIAFESGDGAVSAKVVNAFAEQFIQASLQSKYDSSAYARGFVSDQLTEAKQRLETSEQAVNSYAREKGLIRLADPTDSDSATNSSRSITTVSLIQANEAAIQAKANRIAAEARWNAVSRSSLFSSQAVLGDPTVAGLLASRSRIEAALAEERSRRLDEHPAVEARLAELQQVKADLNRAANNVRQSIRSQYDAALAAEKQLASQVNQFKGETLSEQDSSVQYALLAREADTNRQLYDELLQRYKQLNAAAGISASNITIIDRAQVPSVPSSPSLLFNLALGLLLGGAAAAVAVLLRTEFDDSIRVPEDVEEKLDLSLLGVVPDEGADDLDALLDDPKSVISEAYGSLRGNLLFATPEGLPPTLLVTSSQPSEGKSTTSRALAGSFARIGKKVILVDADIRRPSLHGQLGVANKVGLTSVLTGQAMLSGVVQTSEELGYDYLTAGPTPTAPSELLASTRMQPLIDELADQYDLVIVDSSPVLGLADAPTLSALVDGVIFVVEAGSGRRGALKSSLRRLKTMRPNILGAVLTKFDTRNAANSYSSYYGNDQYQYRAKPDAANG